MNDAFSRCSIELPPEEVIKMHINRLTAATNSLFQRFRNSHEWCTYMEVLQEAKSEGNAFRARAALPSRASTPGTTPVRQTRAVNMTVFSSESTYDQPVSVYGDAEDHLLNDYYVLTSVPPSSMPSMTMSKESKEEEQDNQFLMTPLKRRVAKPRIPGIVTSKRPG